MEISGTSVSPLIGATTAAAAPVNATPTPVNAAESKPAGYEPRKLGLSVLQAEIRQVLSTRLKFSFSSNGYDASKLSVAGVASESLSAASWLLREAPLEAAQELRDLRDDIDDAAEATRGVVSDDDLGDVEEALTRIEGGFDDIDEEAARNTESSASVLTAESMVRQRSMVRIRTQDGDVVTLMLRQRESFSATSAADESGSITELEMNSRSRMDLKVRGDLDDGELQAIKAVFERAQEIAGSFFGGDLAEAFSKASELEFDRSELAKVKMKFREKEVSRIQFTQVGSYPIPQPAVPVSSTAAPTVAEPVSTETVPDVSPVAPESEPEPVVAAADAESVNATPEVAKPETEQPNAIERFVVDLRSFLRTTTEGFEKPDGQRYFYSESFKLSLLKSVFEMSTPKDSDDVSDRAVAVVDAVKEDD